MAIATAPGRMSLRELRDEMNVFLTRFEQIQDTNEREKIGTRITAICGAIQAKVTL